MKFNVMEEYAIDDGHTSKLLGGQSEIQESASCRSVPRLVKEKLVGSYHSPATLEVFLASVRHQLLHHHVTYLRARGAAISSHILRVGKIFRVQSGHEGHAGVCEH
jgi:hypothetical protein